MSTNGETADLMVREGIQITESALKLARSEERFSRNAETDLQI